MRWILRLTAALCLSIASVAAAQVTVIQAGVLLDPASGQVIRDASIIIEGARIRGVVTGATAVGISPPKITAIDLSRYAVLPGLIDGHVHLSIGGTPRDNALADLKAGFTTIVDLGSRATRMLRIKDSINAGQIPGPRVLAAGVWIGTKNGVCEFSGIGIAGGPEAFGARAKDNIDAGADLTKVCLSCWPGESFSQRDSVQMTEAALRAAVAESKARKKPVVAHALSRGSVRM